MFGLEGVLGAGGIKRAKALSPRISNILPVYVKGTAGIIRFLASASGTCRNRVAVKITAAARSDRNRPVTGAPISQALSLTRVSTTVRTVMNRDVRIPPVCSTIGIGNGELCRCTHGKLAIREPREAVRIVRFRQVSRPICRTRSRAVS